MLAEKMHALLSILFPVQKDSAETTVKTDSAVSDETTKSAKDTKPLPRDNGLLVREYAVHGYHLDAQICPDQLLQTVQLIDSEGFFLETITGVDWIADNQLEVIYDFSHYGFEPCRIVVRSRIPRQEPTLPSITAIIAGANWHERETHDFFGIEFTGHPHLIPLLLPEDADFHPLLKDFKA